MVELLKFEDFDQMYSIMEQSFPYDEYRGYEGQKQLFESSHTFSPDTQISL